jgi:polyisoprenoid-binding protein YceI
MAVTTRGVRRGVAVWQLDPARSRIEFAVRHMTMSVVRGGFSRLRGTVWIEDGDPTTARVEVNVDAASLYSGSEDRDRHLRSSDVLDAERFPMITFRSGQVRRLAHDVLGMTGELMIRDLTRGLVLEIREEGPIHDPRDEERVGFSALGYINRSDFGLGWDQELETGAPVVGDQAILRMDVELVRAPTGWARRLRARPSH